MKKSEVQPSRLYLESDKMSLKLMVSAVISWEGISKSFFVDPQQMKGNAPFYTDHLNNDLFPEIVKMYPNNDVIYVQDGASSHTSNLCQDFCQVEFGTHGFVNKKQWPPASPDLNPADYYLWPEVSRRVYEGRRTPFESLEELKNRIIEVWPAVTTRIVSCRKAIL